MNLIKRVMVMFSLVAVSVTIGVGGEHHAKALCSEATTTAAMRACLNQYLSRVDGELNRVYRQVMAQLSGARKTTFKEAQRAWIVFRDKSAAFKASEVEGGDDVSAGLSLGGGEPHQAAR